VQQRGSFVLGRSAREPPGGVLGGRVSAAGMHAKLPLAELQQHGLWMPASSLHQRIIRLAQDGARRDQTAARARLLYKSVELRNGSLVDDYNMEGGTAERSPPPESRQSCRKSLIK